MNPDELIDIELPIAPGIDWGAILSSLGGLLLILVFLFLIWRLLPFVFSSLMLQLKLTKISKKSVEQPVDLTTNQLFVWLGSAAQTGLISPEAMQAYQAKIEAGCFSKNSLTPEEMTEILQSLQQDFRVKLIAFKALGDIKLALIGFWQLLWSKAKSLFLSLRVVSQPKVGETGKSGKAGNADV